MNLRKIGLIGGMSWLSTRTYYEHIQRQVQARAGQRASAPMVIDSLDFSELARLSTKEEWDRAAKVLATSAKQLEKSGATAILIGANSMHKVYDQVANVVKSGGKTRRAAKMVVLDVDHPDIEEFIETKVREEDKIRVLRDAGVAQEVGADAEAPLLVEGERERLGKNLRLHGLRVTVRQFHFRNLREEFVDARGRQHGDVTIRMRNRQERLLVRVHPTPQRRNRETILVVERVLKTA